MHHAKISCWATPCLFQASEVHTRIAITVRQVLLHQALTEPTGAKMTSEGAELSHTIAMQFRPPPTTCAGQLNSPSSMHKCLCLACASPQNRGTSSGILTAWRTSSPTLHPTSSGYHRLLRFFTGSATEMFRATRNTLSTANNTKERVAKVDVER